MGNLDALDCQIRLTTNDGLRTPRRASLEPVASAARTSPPRESRARSRPESFWLLKSSERSPRRLLPSLGAGSSSRSTEAFCRGAKANKQLAEYKSTLGRPTLDAVALVENGVVRRARVF